MIVKSLELQNFRNYAFANIDFNEGINFIIGDNAEGKTNIVEAIFTLAYAKSFRTQESKDMIKEGYKEAKIKARVIEEDSRKDITVNFTEDGKRVFVNNEKLKKISDLNEFVNVLTFIPKDTQLLKDSPKNRRNFLNMTISKMSKQYLSALIEYENVLKQRNDAYKAYTINRDLLDILRDRLIELNYIIYSSRKKFIKEMNIFVKNSFKDIALINEELKIEYEAEFEANSKEEYYELIKNAFLEQETEEFKRKTTLIGTHKEDFRLTLNGRDLGRYGSQGENRMAVLSLKICPYFLIEEQKKKPIIILDDILSELDVEHEKNLLDYLNTFKQVFITGTKKSDYYRGNYYIIENSSIRKEI